jgi:hypothetical protein
MPYYYWHEAQEYTGEMAAPDFYAIGALLKGWAVTANSPEGRIARISGMLECSTSNQIRRRDLAIAISDVWNYICADNHINCLIAQYGARGVGAGMHLGALMAQFIDKMGADVATYVIGEGEGRVCLRNFWKAGFNNDWPTNDQALSEFVSYTKTGIIQSQIVNLYKTPVSKYAGSEYSNCTLAPYIYAALGRFDISQNVTEQHIRASSCGDFALAPPVSIETRNHYGTGGVGGWIHYYVPRSTWCLQLHFLGLANYLGMIPRPSIGADTYYPYVGGPVRMSLDGNGMLLVVTNPGETEETMYPASTILTVGAAGGTVATAFSRPTAGLAYFRELLKR